HRLVHPTTMIHYHMLVMFKKLVSLTIFFTATATTEIYTLSLHDALPISLSHPDDPARTICMIELVIPDRRRSLGGFAVGRVLPRSEEHTSELQSRENLVCRLLLEKKKI